MNKNVAIVTEEMIGESVSNPDYIAKLLFEIGYSPFLISIKDSGWKELSREIPIDKSDFSLRFDGRTINFDFVFIYAEGIKTKGEFQNYLSRLNKPGFPADPRTAYLCGNKHHCKNHLKPLGILSPEGIKLASPDLEKIDRFILQNGYPLMIKPNVGSDSFLNSKVNDIGDLKESVAKILEQGSEVLIEEFIDGTDISCGLFEQNGEIRATPLTEIVHRSEFYDHEVKLNRKNTKITPARISPELTTVCQNLSIEIFKAVGAKGYARIDYILSDESFYFLEFNISPGLSQRSIFPEQLKAMGIDAGQILDKIITNILKENSGGDFSAMTK